MNTFKKAALLAAIFTAGFSGAHAQWKLAGNALAGGEFFGTTDASDIAFITNSAERARLTSGGSLGFGTTTPGRLLHLHATTLNPQLRISDFTGNSWDIWAGGDFHVRTAGGTDWININGTSNWLKFGPNSDLYIDCTNHRVGIGTISPTTALSVEGTVTPNTDCSSTMGTSALRWKNVFARQGTISTSDARLKTNIQDIAYGLGTVQNLRPVTFTWKDDPAYGTKLGLIAQEVQQAVPEVVKLGNDGRMGMIYADLIPVVTKAIQEQQAMLVAETAENGRLKAELATQESRIAQLEAALGLASSQQTAQPAEQSAR